MIWAHLTTFFGAMAASAVLVPVCQRTATRLGYVAQPKADRWHQRSTPLLGGLAIALPVIVGMGFVGGLREKIVLVASAAIITAVGLVDDIVSLKPATKLIAQIALASVFVFLGYRLYWIESMILDSLLTILWVVGITNAFNLLDNMDGLCGGIAFIAGAAFLFAIQLSDPGNAGAVESRYLALMLGAIAGFLIYNVHPASIFMGDAGSLFLGFSLAAVTLVHGQERISTQSLLTVICAPVLVLLIPILDTTLVTLSRLLSGRAPSSGGRDHTSHRLVAIGLSERRAVIVLWTLAAIAALSSFAVRSLDASWSVLLIATLLLAMAVFTVYLGNVRVYEDSDADQLGRKGLVTPLVVDLMYKRRVAEVLLDFCLVTVAYYGAFRLRFEGDQFEPNFPQFIRSLPVVIACQMIALFAVGAYRGVWKYFTLFDSVVFGKGIVVGAVTSQLAVLLFARFQNYSRSVFIIYAAVLFVLLTGSRASFRLISDFASRRRRLGERMVIYGAGAAGGVAVREIMSNQSAPYRIIGFIDDDPKKHRKRVQGYQVLGSSATLEDLLAHGQVDVVLVSSRVMDADKIASLHTLTTKHAVRLIRLHVSLEDVTTPGLKPLRFPSRKSGAS